MRTLHSQRGWVGLLVLLIALLIIGLLSQKLFRQMGLLPNDGAISKSTGPQAGGALSAAPVDPTSVPTTAGNTIERARALEDSLKQQTEEMGKRIDPDTK
jgi:hypothetical protein